ncbi:MAG: hypothetical protein WAK26_06165, partial [Terracidiphilus sp.]
GVGSATGVAGINNITQIIGGSSTANNITGYDVEDGESTVNTTNTWDITSQNSGTLSVTYANTDTTSSYYSSSSFTHTVTFQGFDYLSGTANSNSNFTVEAGGSVTGSISGRPYGPYSGTDTLTIRGRETNESYIISGSDTGTIRLDSNQINYSGIDSILDNSTAGTRTFSYDTNETATLTFVGTPEASDQWSVKVVNGDGTTETFTATVAANQTELDVLDQLAKSMQAGGLDANVSGDMILITDPNGLGPVSNGVNPVTFAAPSDNSVACEVDMPSTTSLQAVMLSLTKDTANTGNLLLTSLNGSFSTISFVAPTSKLSLNGGTGNDFFQVDQSALSALAPLTQFNIDGGGGDDQIVCSVETETGPFSQSITCVPGTASESGALTFIAGSYSTAINYTNIESPYNVVVNGAANDTIELSGSGSNYVVTDGSDTITTGTGIQSLAILGTGSEIITVDLSSGSTFAPALTIDGGPNSTVDLEGNTTYTSLSVSADETVTLNNSIVDSFVFNGVSGDSNAITLTTVGSTVTIVDNVSFPLVPTVIIDTISQTISDANLQSLTINANSNASGQSIELTGGCTLNSDLTLNAGGLNSNVSGSSTVTIDSNGLTLLGGHSLAVQAQTINIYGAVNTSNSAGQAGSIGLYGYNITLETGASLIATGVSADEDGDITISAVDQTAQFIPFADVQITNVSVAIDSGVTITGGNVTITAEADADQILQSASSTAFSGSSAWTQLNTDAGSIGNEALSILQGLLQLPITVSYAEATADVNIASGTTITSSGYFDASSLTVTDVAASPTIAKGGGVAVGVIDADSTIEMGGTVKAANGVAIAATSSNTMNVVADVGALKGVSGAVAVGVLVSNTTADVESTAKINVSGGGISVVSNTTDATRVMARSTSGEDGDEGIAAAVDYEDSQTNSYLDGAATANSTNPATTPSDIDVEANMIQAPVAFKELWVIPDSTNGVSAQAGVGTNSKGDTMADTKSAIISGAFSSLKSLFSSTEASASSNEPTGNGDTPAPADATSSADTGAAYGVAVDLDSATARIGDGTTANKVSTNGNVNVLSSVTYAPAVSASSSVANNPNTAKSDNTSSFSGSVSIAVGYVANSAQAYINTGAQVDSPLTITVESQALNDFSLAYGLNLYDAIDQSANFNTSDGTVNILTGQTVEVESGYANGGQVGYWYTYEGPDIDGLNLGNIDYANNSQWVAVNPVELKAKAFATALTGYLTGDYGVGENIFSTSSQSTASGEQLAVAGAITFLDVQNTSLATIYNGAEINQTIGISNAGNVIVQAQSDNQSVNLIGNLNLPSTDITKLFAGKSGVLSGFSSGAAGDDSVGASVLLSISGDNTQAVIQDGAKVNASSLDVDAETNVLEVGLGVSGGTATNVGFIGTASANYVNDTTLAQIQNGTFIDVGSGTVAGLPSGDDDSVVVNAQDTAYVFSIDGGYVSSEATGVGASAGLNIIERNTQAVIGDLSGTAVPAGSFESGGSVLVSSDNEGYAVVLAVTGSKVSSSTSSSSGSGSSGSGNSGTGGTQGSDGSAGSDADLAGWQTKYSAVLSEMQSDGQSTDGVAGEANSEGADASSSKAGVGISGSAGVNYLDDTSDAWITNAPTLNVGGSLSLLAQNNTNVINVAGAGAFATSTGSSSAVAASGAFALNILEGGTDASINGAAGLDVDGLLSLEALRDGWTISMAAGLSSADSEGSSYAVAGSVGVNVLLYTTTTELENINGAVETADGVYMDAEDDSALGAISGSAALGGSVGVGVGIGFTYEATTTSSTISNIGTLAKPFSYSTGDMDVYATNNELLIGETGSVGIADGDSGDAGAGTVSVNYT